MTALFGAKMKGCAGEQEPQAAARHDREPIGC